MGSSIYPPSPTTHHLFVTLNRLFVTVVWKNRLFIGIFDIKVCKKTLVSIKTEKEEERT